MALRNKILSMSISGYAIAFLLLVATFFIGLGLYSYKSLQMAGADIQVSNRQIARSELQHAIFSLLKNINRLGRSIAEWDEIFQQIDNPAYYSYWRAHRLLSTDLIPDYVFAAEVFDASGQVLAEFDDSEFPRQIDIADLQPRVIVGANSTDILLFLAVRRQTTAGSSAEGYLGLRFPFLATINHHAQYRFIDADTLRVKAVSGESVALEQAVDYIEYDINSSPETETLLAIVKRSVIQLASVIAILCVLFYMLITYLFSKPLSQISLYIDQLRHSDPGSLGRNIHSLLEVTELEKVRQSLNQYHEDLAAVQGDLDRKNQELWEQAHHDALTGVMNRRAFELEYSKSRELLGHHRVGLALLLFDLNHFKAINDSYGHQVGDEVLKAVSQCIQGALRRKENLYRIGGDEFAVILIGSSTQDALIAANRCLDAVNGYDFSQLGIKESVRISCGIAHCEADQIDRLEALQWQADIAVYQAKRPGVSRPILFTDDMADGTESVFSSWISNAVYEAVVHGSGIEMHYQPVVEASSGHTAYYESLLRIRHDGEMVPPANIFPIVAMRHMEMEMDQAVIRKVIEDLQQQRIPPASGVAINLSAQSVSHEQLIQWLKPLTPFLDRYAIVLEVTETSLITQLNAAAGNLEQLRAYGFKIALDDFGSGYSSLRYLINMPVDTIKFDISLIQGMEDERLHKMVTDLASMLIELEFDLVAEGIEDQQLQDKVATAGFKFLQGYHLGRPQRMQPTQSTQPGIAMV